MRLPRVQFKVRRLMVAVAAVAGLLTWSITRPYPVMSCVDGWQRVMWSDRRITTVSASKPLVWRGNSWFHAIDWPDGGTSYYLALRPGRIRIFNQRPDTGLKH
jgi:hypothetical protein